MKKLIASILFFGSFGVVLAQAGPGGVNDPYYHTNWNPPVPNPNSCGTHKVKKVKRTVREDGQPNPNCQSPWHYSSSVDSRGVLIPELSYAVNQPFRRPLRLPDISGQRDRDPRNAAATAYHNAVHDDNGAYIANRFDIVSGGVKIPYCSVLSNNPAGCDSAILVPKSTSFRGGRDTLAQLYNIFINWLARNNNSMNFDNAIINFRNLAISPVSACQWYEEVAVIEEDEKNKCFSDVCIDINMRMQRIQMEIHGLNQKLSSPDLDAGTKAEIQARIERLKKVLQEESLSCNANKACISDSIPMDAAGLSEGYASCRAKPFCPCPSPAEIPENNPKCRPNPYCMRQQ